MHGDSPSHRDTSGMEGVGFLPSRQAFCGVVRVCPGGKGVDVFDAAGLDVS